MCVIGSHGTQYLNDRIREKLGTVDASIQEHGNGNCRIHVSATHVSDHIDDTRKRRANRQPVASEEDYREKQECPEELCNKRQVVHLSTGIKPKN